MAYRREIGARLATELYHYMLHESTGSAPALGTLMRSLVALQVGRLGALLLL